MHRASAYNFHSLVRRLENSGEASHEKGGRQLGSLDPSVRKHGVASCSIDGATRKGVPTLGLEVTGRKRLAVTSQCSSTTSSSVTRSANEYAATKAKCDSNAGY